MDFKITGLDDAFSRGELDRREFLGRVSVLVGGTAATGALLSSLEGGRALAALVAPDDPRLQARPIKYPAATGEVGAYLALPHGGSKLPGVVVIHENRGLNAHIEDVARRVAVEGFLALAPDALSPLGGTPQDPDQARDMIGKLEPRATVDNFVAAVRYLKSHPRSTGKVGVVGFCWGGAMANQVAVHSPDLVAAVPYYGRPPASADVPPIKAALLLHYAGIDEAINPAVPEYEAALKKAGVNYQVFRYDGAKHAFNNDTNPERYHQEAAGLAWRRTIAFLKEKLKT
jgi:carboxymethylenebutenolidase